MGGSNEGVALIKALASAAGKTFKVVNGTGVSAKSHGPDVTALLKDVVKQDVLVGIPGDKANRKDAEELNNAARAYILNFGAPEANIPAREFMASGIAAVQDKVSAYLRDAVNASLAGDTAMSDQSLHMAGQVARDSIKDRISSNIPPPLAERTIAERKAKGIKSTKTLEETGEMRNAVNYVVRKK